MVIDLRPRDMARSLGLAGCVEVLHKVTILQGVRYTSGVGFRRIRFAR